MRSRNPGCLNFKKTIDSLHYIKDLIRNWKQSNEILTEILWESGVLNTSTPRGLLNAAFYTVGKMFCLIEVRNTDF